MPGSLIQFMATTFYTSYENERQRKQFEQDDFTVLIAVVGVCGIVLTYLDSNSTITIQISFKFDWIKIGKLRIFVFPSIYKNENSYCCKVRSIINISYEDKYIEWNFKNSYYLMLVFPNFFGNTYEQMQNFKKCGKAKIRLTIATQSY